MLYAVIMAGGVGERFWPASRVKTPKQLLKFGKSDKVLLEETCNRLSKFVDKQNIYIITNKKQVKGVQKALPLIPESNIIAEPCSRNTAACIGLASILIKHKDSEAISIVLPADHRICDQEGFDKTISLAIKAAQDNRLVTIGIAPTRPETEYGYIEVGNETVSNTCLVKNFKEKPNLEKAKEFCEAGNFLWNSGIFVWKVETILQELTQFMPKLHVGLEKIQKTVNTSGFLSCVKQVYKGLDKISIDYGVLEKSNKVVVVKNSFDWDDLGLWTAMERLHTPDENKNFKINGEAVFIDASGNIVSTDNGMVSVLGVNDLIIIRDKNAILICKKDRAKDVKMIVEKLKTQKKNKFL